MCPCSLARVNETTASPSGPTNRLPDAGSAAAIVAALDRPTKVKLLSGKATFALEGLPGHGLDPIAVSDGPHGLRHQPRDGDHLGLQGSLPATCFPTAAALGSSWDVDLLDEVGRAIGAEAVDQGVTVVLGPGLNIKRHPAGGRSFEYLSEDPFLSGKLAAAMVRGVQSHGVGTSIKHFAANNHESHRLIVDAVVDERTLREIYLTGFEIAVKESAPWTVMCAYNLVNGVYASEHTELLTTILRDEWGFEGLVMTDWGAANDRVAGIRAGLDLEMPTSGGAFDPAVLAALDDGSLTEDEVDRCATRVVQLLQRARRDSVAADYDAHHQLGRRAAAAGSVLLTNNGVLPLHPTPAAIAVVGAFATEPRYQGAGSSQVNPTRLDSLLDELRSRVGTSVSTSYAAGYDARTGETNDTLIDEAVGVAAAADVVILCVGLPAAWESEGFDRTTLDLPAGHVRLIEALAAQSTPVAVVLSNGGVVHMPWADRVDAVLECWLGGQAGAGGAVDVLVGDAEPGGRLAESIPFHVAALPADRNFPGSPRQVQYRESLYVGYRFHDTAGVPAKFPFGHGLSYTRFEWSDFSVEGTGTDLVVSLVVANVGTRAGSDVVQVYVRDPEATLHCPDKELKGFRKVHLEPGESSRVEIALDRRAFAVWDVAAHDWLVEAGAFEILVGRSSTDIVTTIRGDIDSPDTITAAPRPSGFVATDEEFREMYGRPIPSVPPTRPFHRNSTLEEMSSTRLGRLVEAAVVRESVRRAAHEFPDPDDATLEMIRSAVREGPARALVLLSGGLVPFDAIDALIAGCNGDRRAASAAIRRLVKRKQRSG